MLYREVEDWKAQIECHVKLKNENAEQWDMNGKTKIAEMQKFNTDQWRFINMVTEFESIWNGHRGCKSVVKHHIEIALTKARQIYCAPYRSGPGLR